MIVSVLSDKQINTRIKSALAEVQPYSDNDEAFMKGSAYSMLALLWGRNAPRDNVDYGDLGYPQHLSMTAPDAEVEAAYVEQSRVASEVYGTLMALFAEVGPEAAVTAMLTETEYGPFWYVAARFYQAEEEYGPHPDGFTVTEHGSGRDYRFSVWR